MVNTPEQSALPHNPPRRVEEGRLLVVVRPAPGQDQQGGDQHLGGDGGEGEGIVRRY